MLDKSGNFISEGPILFEAFGELSLQLQNAHPDS
jgi:hypothetical protein